MGIDPFPAFLFRVQVMIHDNIYNEISNWNYTAFAEAICSNAGAGLFTAKCKTMGELDAAFKAVQSEENLKKLCFVEVILDRTDCTRELLEWGSRVAASNSRA